MFSAASSAVSATRFARVGGVFARLIHLGASGDPGAAPQTTIEGYMMGFSKRSFQTTV